MFIFGLSGLAILAWAWLWPVPVAEKIMGNLAGLTGLLVAAVQLRRLKLPHTSGAGNAVPVKVEVEHNR